MGLQLPKPRGHLEGTQHDSHAIYLSVLSYAVYSPVRILPITHPIYRVGVSLCQAQISLVGGTWEGFLMTLLGLKIVEWATVSDLLKG